VKLLIIDSDRHLVEMLAYWLKTQGYEVLRAYTLDQAKQVWEERHPDLVILDPMLEDGDALAMCHNMQSKHDALLIVLTAAKEVQTEVQCLESGADDYLCKPFFPSQLLARIRAVSRRARSTLEQRLSSIVTVGPICVDSLHNVVTIHSKTSRLTPTEGRLLHLLAVNANDVCTAEQIVTHVWGYDGDADAPLIKAHIRHLRQKIELDPSHPSYILTVPGEGYSLVHHPVGEHEVENKRKIG
jgi:DNA-binding response OmpR family regulator